MRGSQEISISFEPREQAAYDIFVIDLVNIAGEDIESINTTDFQLNVTDLEPAETYNISVTVLYEGVLSEPRYVVITLGEIFRCIGMLYISAVSRVTTLQS